MDNSQKGLLWVLGVGFVLLAMFGATHDPEPSPTTGDTSKQGITAAP